MKMLPDRTAASIQVLRSDRSDDGACRRVLVHIHHIRGLIEHRGLVHIQNVNLDRCCVFEGPEALKTCIQMCIGGIYLEGIGLLAFKVQRLEQSRENLIHLITSHQSVSIGHSLHKCSKQKHRSQAGQKSTIRVKNKFDILAV